MGTYNHPGEIIIRIVQTRREIDQLFTQVEDQLFKITRRMFEESSEMFSTIFSPPQGGSSPVDGSDDEHPLVLQGIKSTDFENLLKAIVDAGRSTLSAVFRYSYIIVN